MSVFPVIGRRHFRRGSTGGSAGGRRTSTQTALSHTLDESLIQLLPQEEDFVLCEPSFVWSLVSLCKGESRSRWFLTPEEIDILKELLV